MSRAGVKGNPFGTEESGSEFQSLPTHAALPQNDFLSLYSLKMSVRSRPSASACNSTRCSSVAETDIGSTTHIHTHLNSHPSRHLMPISGFSKCRARWKCAQENPPLSASPKQSSGAVSLEMRWSTCRCCVVADSCVIHRPPYSEHQHDKTPFTHHLPLHSL
jgi:hypothetical protein